MHETFMADWLTALALYVKQFDFSLSSKTFTINDQILYQSNDKRSSHIIPHRTSRDIACNNALIHCQNRRVVTSSHVKSRRLHVIMDT